MTDTPDRDQLTRFLIDHAGVRGVRVHLDATWQQIRERVSDVPAAAVELLGESCAAAALFTGHAKVDGRLSVQLRGEGPVRTLFAECTAAGTLRGIVRVADAAAQVPRDLQALAPAVLAITIENPATGQRDPVRYQGLVALEGEHLGEAFEGYFAQSEQLPTRLLLACDNDRATGLMVQKLPGDAGDDDGWTRVGALFDTLTPDELLDAAGDELLLRLFHEDGVRLMGSRPLSFACSCSLERVEAMLASLGSVEARAAAAESGAAEVRCEFCGQQYAVPAARIETLLDAAAAEVEAPGTLQ